MRQYIKTLRDKIILITLFECEVQNLEILMMASMSDT